MEIGETEGIKDHYIFRYQEQYSTDIIAIYSFHQGNNSYLILLKSNSVLDFSKQIEIGLLAVPQAREISDVHMTPTGDVSVITIDKQGTPCR